MTGPTGGGSGWDPELYLRFSAERARPCRDLIERIELVAPRSVVDLGCGPGNSVALLKARWPRARYRGVDNDRAMLERASPDDPAVEWVEADLARWAPPESTDLLFANASLQWVPDHLATIHRLFGSLDRGGVLAFQLPANDGDASHRASERVAQRARWQGVKWGERPDARVLSLDQYYDRLSPDASRLDLWETRYVHRLPGPDAVVEWTRGTGLRPMLDALRTDSDRGEFLDQYREEIARAYPVRPDGTLLFPFLRRFVVGYRR